MNILGIESTCDETGVAVVLDGREVLVNLVSSSVNFHKKYGGVIPEVAAREQLRVMIPLIAEATRVVSRDKIDAIAVSFGPGLVGSLLVGVETAKALSYCWEKPLIAVNHLVGHIYANWLIVDSSQLIDSKNGGKPKFPAVGLVVSGGHTDLILIKGHRNFKLLGSTLDDAAGEAFDKVSRFLGLGYPGGPEIERCARKFRISNLEFQINRVDFPRPLINANNYDFSFSGLKTAVVNYVNRSSGLVNREKIAYYFQEAVVDVLVTKTLAASEKFAAESIIVAGGVAANNRLRDEFKKRGEGLKIFFPDKKFSVDNGAMIAAAAFFNQDFSNPLKLSASPSLHFN